MGLYVVVDEQSVIHAVLCYDGQYNASLQSHGSSGNRISILDAWTGAAHAPVHSSTLSSCPPSPATLTLLALITLPINPALGNRVQATEGQENATYSHTYKTIATRLSISNHSPPLRHRLTQTNDGSSLAQVTNRHTTSMTNSAPSLLQEFTAPPSTTSRVSSRCSNTTPTTSAELHQRARRSTLSNDLDDIINS